MDDRPRIEPGSRAAWRAWLEANHATAPGAWVVYPRRRFAAPGEPGYEDLVEEALCFGWIDNRPGKVDDRRVSLYLAPRRPRSGWAASNKERIRRLEAYGSMAPAGLAAVERAKADGSWAMLDRAEAAEAPPDLVAALDRHPGAREHWDAFSRGTRKMLIGWIDMAKRPATRAARVEETASRAARNERPAQWVAKDPP
jgi:uncharacterized protein YdeI (YjbR/CyaY-like superfamily)